MCSLPVVAYVPGNTSYYTYVLIRTLYFSSRLVKKEPLLTSRKKVVRAVNILMFYIFRLKNHLGRKNGWRQQQQNNNIQQLYLRKMNLLELHREVGNTVTVKHFYLVPGYFSIFEAFRKYRNNHCCCCSRSLLTASPQPEDPTPTHQLPNHSKATTAATQQHPSKVSTIKSCATPCQEVRWIRLAVSHSSPHGWLLKD